MAFERKYRNFLLLAATEAASGVDQTPAAATHAQLVSGEISITPLEAERVPRNITRGYFGAPETLQGATWMSVRFGIVATGGGAAGTPPRWGSLLRACAFAETITASNRVDYTPVSSALETATIYVYADGLLYKFVGASGTLDGQVIIGGIPVWQFTFWAPYLAPVAQANPSPTFASVTEVLVSDANTADLVLGGTYSAGVISGGSTRVTGGVEFSLGNAISRLELIGAKKAEITDRAVTGTVRTMDLSAAQEISILGQIEADTKQSIGIVHGTATGNKVLVFFPAARMTGLAHSNFEGVLTSDVTFEAPPTSGNDDMRIVAL